MVQDQDPREHREASRKASPVHPRHRPGHRRRRGIAMERRCCKSRTQRAVSHQGQRQGRGHRPCQTDPRRRPDRQGTTLRRNPHRHRHPAGPGGRRAAGRSQWPRAAHQLPGRLEGPGRRPAGEAERCGPARLPRARATPAGTGRRTREATRPARRRAPGDAGRLRRRPQRDAGAGFRSRTDPRTDRQDRDPRTPSTGRSACATSAKAHSSPPARASRRCSRSTG